MSTLSVLVPSVVAVLVLLSLSAFFSSTESAIFSLPEAWIETAAADGSPESRTLQRLRADPHRLLVTILVGNNIVNIGITSIVTLVVARFVPPGAAVVVATLGVSVLILVFGEIVPKSYGLGHARSWSLRVARPVSHVERLLGPVVTLFDAVTRRLTTVVGGDQGIEDPYLDGSARQE
jgi:Mg2+/Co2+ transporter CorB